MTTWVLTFFVFVGPHVTAEGGVATIEGFTSKEKCEAHIEQTLKPRFPARLAWAYCDKVDK